MFETTCTLYETDPKTSSWVSKGTGIIHVNIDKDSGASPKNSRLSILPLLLLQYELWVMGLVMRQQGTMKVMWNIRLFKGMQLLPRQVSDGDRRMDVYVKMVLVDNGQPKSYAIKVTPPLKCAFTDKSYETIRSWINCTQQSGAPFHRDGVFCDLDFLSTHGEYLCSLPNGKYAEKQIRTGRFSYKYIHKPHHTAQVLVTIVRK